MKKIILLVGLIVGLTSCNYFTRKLGFTQNINLEPGETLINVSWKGDNLWCLVKTHDGRFLYKEYSNLGILEGKVYINQK